MNRPIFSSLLALSGFAFAARGNVVPTVIRTGMTAADKIVMGPRFNFGSPFDSLPLVNYEPESRQGRESCSDSRDCADPAVHIHCLEQ